MSLDKRFDRMHVNGYSIRERNERPLRYADRIAELDKNKDGKVTSGEFFDTLMARFDAADTNHDQVLTSEERMAADIPKDQSEDDADGDIANATEAAATNQSGTDRKSVEEGTSVSVRVDHGGRRNIKNKKQKRSKN